jgi:hydrogenase nickel incorporation protein HypA/HybF
MHELSVAKGVVDRTVAAAAEHGPDRVDGLTLAVGAATHLNPDQLRFCVETVAAGTIAEGATVTVDRVPPRAACDCGWAGEPDAVEDAYVYVPDPVCPDCGARVDLTEGRGCRLASIDVPANDDATPDRSETPPSTE